MQRQYPNQPILAVGGVVMKGDAVLLVRRRRDPQKGEWSIPGGAVRAGERVGAALRRELREETGISITTARLLGVFERIVRKGARVQYHYVVLDYACKWTRGQVAPASDASAAKWVQRGDLAGYSLRAETTAVIREAFEVFENIK